MENRNITVRVLNGTEFSGFAQAVSSALQNSEFNTQAAGNYTSSQVERTMIIFGKNAVNQAYTVNSNFTDAKMVMDDREDMLIDVVVGATFDNLQDQLAEHMTHSDFRALQHAIRAYDFELASQTLRPYSTTTTRQ